MDQAGIDQEPVEAAGLSAVLAGLEQALAAKHDFLLLLERGIERSHARGIKPSRLAMILSTVRFGSSPVIRCRIGSGVIW